MSLGGSNLSLLLTQRNGTPSPFTLHPFIPISPFYFVTEAGEGGFQYLGRFK